MYFELLRDFLQDLKAHRTRAILTLVAITWGTVAVVLLLSFGEGLGDQMMKGLLNAGDRIMIIYGGETGLVFDGLPKGRRIRMVEDDADLLARAIPSIRYGFSAVSEKYYDDLRDVLDHHRMRGSESLF